METHCLAGVCFSLFNPLKSHYSYRSLVLYTGGDVTCALNTRFLSTLVPKWSLISLLTASMKMDPVLGTSFRAWYDNVSSAVLRTSYWVAVHFKILSVSAVIYLRLLTALQYP